MTLQRDCKPLWWTSRDIPLIRGAFGRQRPILVIEAGLEGLRGNSAPYWSVTGHAWSSASAKARGCDICAFGCLHDEISKVARWLRPVIAIHLCDDNGAPSHAVANAVYWAGGTEYQAAKPDTLAKHLRVPLEEAERIVARIAEASGDKAKHETMAEIIEPMRSRWKAEAEAARALLIEHGATVTEC